MGRVMREEAGCEGLSEKDDAMTILVAKKGAAEFGFETAGFAFGYRGVYAPRAALRRIISRTGAKRRAWCVPRCCTHPTQTPPS